MSCDALCSQASWTRYSFSNNARVKEVQHDRVGAADQQVYLSIQNPGGRFTKSLGALFSVQSIPMFPSKWCSETVPRN